MKHPSVHQFLDRLESNIISISASSSPRSWLAAHAGMSEGWSVQTLSILIRSAESGRADLAAWQGEEGKALFERLSGRQLASLSGKAQVMLRKGSHPYFDYVAAQELRKRIDLSDKELHHICHRAARIASRHAGADDETLLTAFFAAYHPSDETLSCDYARAVGYCVGVVREAGRQLREKDDKGFAEGVTALILWTGMIAGVLGGIVIFDLLGAIAALLYGASAVILLLAACDHWAEPPEDVLLAFIQDGVIARKSAAAGRAVLRHARLTDYPGGVEEGILWESGHADSAAAQSSHQTVYA